jgi:hypothetical protein
MNMKENFKTCKDFAIEIIAEGSFNDAPDDIAPHTYRTETKTFRLNRVAMHEWDRSVIIAEEPKGSEEFEKIVEWYTYLDEKKELRANFENKIRHALGYDDWDSFVIMQVLRNIFTVVAVKEITK